jgi:predicted negative regulator of RcsB-dependent stress response
MWPLALGTIIVLFLGIIGLLFWNDWLRARLKIAEQGREHYQNVANRVDAENVRLRTTVLTLNELNKRVTHFSVEDRQRIRDTVKECQDGLIAKASGHLLDMITKARQAGLTAAQTLDCVESVVKSMESSFSTKALIGSLKLDSPAKS